MSGGIAGFADGFSSGLNQGMGIIHANRAEKRAQAEQDKRFAQMDHSMALQDKQEGRAAEQHAENMDTAKWTKENLRPLTLKQTQLSVDKYEQDIKIGGVEYAQKQLDLEWAPKLKAQGYRLAENQDRRAEESLDFSIEQGRHNMRLADNQDARASQQQNVAIGAQVLPVYTEMLSRGIEPPKAMQDIIKQSPFGITQQMELARASESFEPIMQSASKGDFSFMEDGEKRESAFSLARPVGMRIARQKGFDATSARVTGIVPQKDGSVALTVVARDPKTGAYRQFQHGVNAGGLVDQMQLSARSGMALRQHPAYEKLQQALPGYISAFKGDVREAAATDWAQQYDRYSKVAREAPDSPEGQQASAWLQQNGNRDKYVNDMAAGRFRTQNGRGDAAPADYNRVFSTVTKATGITDPGEAMKRANGAIAIMKRLGDKGIKKSEMPTVFGMASGSWHNNASDPAYLVNLYYQLQSSPKARAEMANALRGGQGAGNPSGGRYRPINNAGVVGARIFGSGNITQNRRDPNSELGKKNPNSWHVHSGAAIDVRPIKGMTFEQARAQIQSRGYKLIEAKNEVGAGRSKHATGDHWHFVLGT